VSRLPAPLARRLDRLAWRAHLFHRWAHHPLCDAYAPEVIRLGRRTRLCRGCARLAAGAAAGLVLGPWLHLPGPALLAGLLLLGPALLLAVAPRRGPAGAKVRTRLVPAALAGLLVSAGVAAASAPGLLAAAGALALTAVARWRYGRRGPDRTPCLACPEAPPGPRCSGFREAARRERAFRRLAARWIARAGPASCDAARP
jgi:hypothetical protein